MSLTDHVLYELHTRWRAFEFLPRMSYNDAVSNNEPGIALLVRNTMLTSSVFCQLSDVICSVHEGLRLSPG